MENKYNHVEIKSGKGYLEKIFAIAEENRKLALVIIVLVALVMYLAVSLVKIKQNMILSVNIPEVTYVTGKAQVARDRANMVFYEMWGSYLVNEKLANYSHENIKEKYTYILDNLSPEMTGKYLSSIKTKVKNTTSQLVAHSYTEGKSEIKGDQYGATYISYGKSIKKIGEIETISETCEYQVDVSVHNFTLKIDRIFEKCDNIKKGKF